jgi:hypothetical protein
MEVRVEIVVRPQLYTIKPSYLIFIVHSATCNDAYIFLSLLCLTLLTELPNRKGSRLRL